MAKVTPGGSDGDVSPEAMTSELPKSDLDKQLVKAAGDGQLDEVKKLLQCKANIEAKDPKDEDRLFSPTPLHCAAENGHRDVVELLVEEKADIEAKSGENHHTPVGWAAKKGHREVVALLLEKNAEVAARDHCKETPLHYAARNGHREVVDLLVEENADIEAKSGFEETPLHVAASHGHGEVVGFLLKKNATIDAKRIGERTPLELAADGGYDEVVTLLLEKRADLDFQACFAIVNGCQGVEAHHYFFPLITKKNLWNDSRWWNLSILIGILKPDNQESIVKMLELWPQDAVIRSDRSGGPKELKRASVPERLRAVVARRYNNNRLAEKDAQFGAQNLLWAPEVPVTLKFLPGVCGSDALDQRFLKTLQDSPHDGIFETDAVQGMVLAAWQQYRAYTLLEILSCCLTVICLCLASYGLRQGFAWSAPCLYVAAVLHLKKSFDESVQALQYLIQYLTCREKGSYFNFDNAADALYIVAGWLAMERQLFFVGSEDLEKPWMAVFAACAWLRLLYSLRAETWMGPRLLPILSAIKDTLAFFLLMVMCLAAAAHAYYNLQIREEPGPTYAAVMQVVRLGIFGDFDLFEFEGLDPTYKLKDDDNEWEPIDPTPGPDYVYVHVLFYMTGVGWYYSFTDECAYRRAEFKLRTLRRPKCGSVLSSTGEDACGASKPTTWTGYRKTVHISRGRAMRWASCLPSSELFVPTGIYCYVHCFLPFSFDYFTGVFVFLSHERHHLHNVLLSWLVWKLFCKACMSWTPQGIYRGGGAY